MRMARYLYSELARAQHNVNKSLGGDFQRDYLDALTKWLPSGSGIDVGTKVDAERTHAERLVLTFGFHHMNDGGYYDGWTEHTAVVTPSFYGDFNLRVTGRDRNQVKDSLYQTYEYALHAECSIVFWQVRLGDACPKIQTRWIDQSRLVYDVKLPDADVQTFDSRAETRTHGYTNQLESARAYVSAWCARNYWEVGRARTAEERARYDADMNARNGGTGNE